MLELSWLVPHFPKTLRYRPFCDVEMNRGPLLHASAGRVVSIPFVQERGQISIRERRRSASLGTVQAQLPRGLSGNPFTHRSATEDELCRCDQVQGRDGAGEDIIISVCTKEGSNCIKAGQLMGFHFAHLPRAAFGSCLALANQPGELSLASICQVRTLLIEQPQCDVEEAGGVLDLDANNPQQSLCPIGKHLKFAAHHGLHAVSGWAPQAFARDHVGAGSRWGRGRLVDGMFRSPGVARYWDSVRRATGSISAPGRSSMAGPLHRHQLRALAQAVVGSLAQHGLQVRRGQVGNQRRRPF